MTIAAIATVPAPASAGPDDGISRIQSTTGGANLRSCPSLPNYGVTTGECGVITWLPNDTRVLMRCWQDGNAPERGVSPRWFWVTEVDGPNAGHSGYVWSNLVADQVRTDVCEGLRFDFAPPGPELFLEPGPQAPSGYRYAITLTGFTANTDVSVTCHDTTDPGGFYTFTITTDEHGDAFTDRQCWSGDGPNHWVTATGATSGPISW